MKNFLNLFTAILFISTAILMSCGGTEPKPEEENPQEITGKAMSTGTATPSTVTVDDGTGSTTVTNDWSDFTLTFTVNADFKGGTYSTTNSASDLVWPASGTWAFDGDKSDKIIRDGDGSKSIDITANTTTMSLAFNVPTTGGRILTFNGAWSFIMSF